MIIREARLIGQHVVALLDQGRVEEAYSVLSVPLAERTPFRMLDEIGKAIGSCEPSSVNPLLERIALERSMGGWVIIGTALSGQRDADPPGSFRRCREFIVTADVWYGCDSLGERFPGPALVRDIEQALTLLSSWRIDSNRWVRRAVGVAVHVWAKRSCGETDLIHQAQALLEFLEPMLGEQNADAVKGIGWGLKTLGRFYPELAADWLAGHISHKHPRRLMLRKALTYLPPEQRQRMMIKNP